MTCLTSSRGRKWAILKFKKKVEKCGFKIYFLESADGGKMFLTAYIISILVWWLDLVFMNHKALFKSLFHSKYFVLTMNILKTYI